MSCGVGCRRGSDPEVLWLWRRPGGYGSDSTPSLGTSNMPREVALEKAKRPKKREREKKKKKKKIVS